MTVQVAYQCGDAAPYLSEFIFNLNAVVVPAVKIDDPIDTIRDSTDTKIWPSIKRGTPLKNRFRIHGHRLPQDCNIPKNACRTRVSNLSPEFHQ
jgi:hypothetical protein